MQTTGSSGIFKTIYHNGSSLLLLGKRKSQILKFHVSNFSYFQISASIFYAEHLKASKPNQAALIRGNTVCQLHKNSTLTIVIQYSV